MGKNALSGVKKTVLLIMASIVFFLPAHAAEDDESFELFVYLRANSSQVLPEMELLCMSVREHPYVPGAWIPERIIYRALEKVTPRKRKIKIGKVPQTSKVVCQIVWESSMISGHKGTVSVEWTSDSCEVEDEDDWAYLGLKAKGPGCRGFRFWPFEK